MNMLHIKTSLLALALFGGSAMAQHTGHHTPTAAPAAPASTPSAAAAGELPWTEAEVRRVDVRNGKVTLKHGDIVNLGMPPMTMAFQAREPQALAALKVGDRVRFTSDQINGAYTVLRIEPLP